MITDNSNSCSFTVTSLARLVGALAIPGGGERDHSCRPYHHHDQSTHILRQQQRPERHRDRQVPRRLLQLAQYSSPYQTDAEDARRPYHVSMSVQDYSKIRL